MPWLFSLYRERIDRERKRIRELLDLAYIAERISISMETLIPLNRKWTL